MLGAIAMEFVIFTCTCFLLVSWAECVATTEGFHFRFLWSCVLKMRLLLVQVHKTHHWRTIKAFISRRDFNTCAFILYRLISHILAWLLCFLIIHTGIIWTNSLFLFAIPLLTMIILICRFFFLLIFLISSLLFLPVQFIFNLLCLFDCLINLIFVFLKILRA